MGALLLWVAMTVAQQYDALILDLDGTVWNGGTPIPNVVESLNKAPCKRMYVTNNASRAPQAVADILSSMGLSVGAEDVLTSAQAAVEIVRGVVEPGAAVLVLGTDSFRDLASEAGFRVVDSADDNPQAVLHGHSTDNGWAQLSEAALAIGRGAKYFASNLDSTLPSERGMTVGNGSMVAAVTHATGVEPEAAGKPGPAMFHSAARRMGSQVPLAVGDRLNTDIAGGVAAGMDTLQVMTGVSGYYDTLYATPDQQATLIAEDMTSLFHEAQELLPGPQGGFTAWVENGSVVLDGGQPGATPIQALRTAIGAVRASGASVSGVQFASPAAQEAISQWT